MCSLTMFLSCAWLSFSSASTATHSSHAAFDSFEDFECDIGPIKVVVARSGNAVWGPSSLQQSARRVFARETQGSRAREGGRLARAQAARAKRGDGLLARAQAARAPGARCSTLSRPLIISCRCRQSQRWRNRCARLTHRVPVAHGTPRTRTRDKEASCGVRAMSVARVPLACRSLHAERFRTP